jgi:hypothetical protein
MPKAKDQSSSSTSNREKFVFFIDKKKYETDEDELSVGDIIRDYANEDPNDVSLGIRDGNDFDKFEDTRTEVPLTDAPHFVIFHNTPTPVS